MSGEAINLPVDGTSSVGWSNRLENSGASETGIFENIGIPGNGTFKTPPEGAIGAEFRCEIVPNPESSTGGLVKRVQKEIQLEGQLKPEIGGALNGSSALAPSQIRFNGAKTGALESEAGPGAERGNVKYLNYQEQALLRVKAE